MSTKSNKLDRVYVVDAPGARRRVFRNFDNAMRRARSSRGTLLATSAELYRWERANRGKIAVQIRDVGVTAHKSLAAAQQHIANALSGKVYANNGRPLVEL